MIHHPILRDWICRKHVCRKHAMRPWLLSFALCVPTLLVSQAFGQTPPSEPPNARHLVRPGDTLWNLSRQYMHTPLRWPEIQRDNGVTTPEQLQPGKMLTLGSFASVLEVSGDVFLNRGAVVQQPLTFGTALMPGDVLVTGRNGFLTVGLADGSRSVIPSSSAIRLLEARGRATRFELIDGRIESYVEKKKERDFEIRTRTFALGVKGTHFRARSEAQADTIEVLEGSVVATELEGSQRSVALAAGQGASLVAGVQPQPQALLPAPEQLPTTERNLVDARPVDGTQSYHIQLARDPDFLQLVAELRSDIPRFQLGSDIATGFYHTRLSAFDSQQIEGYSSNGVVFVDQRPPPEKGNVRRLADGRYEIRWTARHGRHHTFELALSADFSAPLLSESGSYPNGIIVGPFEQAGVYYWRCSEDAEEESLPKSVWSGSFETSSR